MLGKKAKEPPIETQLQEALGAAKFPLSVNGYDCKSVDKFINTLSKLAEESEVNNSKQSPSPELVQSLELAIADSETHAKELEEYADALEAKLATLEQENARIKSDAEAVIRALQAK